MHTGTRMGKRKSSPLREQHSLLEAYNIQLWSSQQDTAVKLSVPQANLHSLVKQLLRVRVNSVVQKGFNLIQMQMTVSISVISIPEDI